MDPLVRFIRDAVSGNNEDYWLDQRVDAYNNQGEELMETSQQNTTNVPKPHPPVVKKEQPKVESKPSPKVPFMRKPHLTQRPFANNEQLAQIAAKNNRKISPKAKRQR